MYRRVLAFDYDGTLARDGIVPVPLVEALQQLHVSGCILFLVTGRRFESLELGPLSDIFAGIVWENGAVLSRPATQEVVTPFGNVPAPLIQLLEAAHIPLEYGSAIVSTWEDFEYRVWGVLRQMGSDVGLIRNKGALMIVPPGATKGTGLELLLTMCGFSPRNLTCFGDGENDVSMLQLGEVGITIADAAPLLSEIADVVMELPGPDGVLQALQRYWLGEDAPDLPVKQMRHWVPLGRDQDDQPVMLPGSELIGKNLGIFGDSASGKSWAAGLLAEGLHLSGYQLLIIDPEGDYRGLRALSNIIALSCEPQNSCCPGAVATILEKTHCSVVLDLSAYPFSLRESYVGDLLHAIHPLRENRARPHWILIDETQFFTGVPDIRLLLESTLPMGGYAFVSFRPEYLSPTILRSIEHTLLTHMSSRISEQVLHDFTGLQSAAPINTIPHGCALLDGQRLIWVTGRRVQHIRHLYKYLDMPLPKHKRFYFRSEGGFLGCEAASLFEMHRMLETLPLESVLYHQHRGDFANWVRTVLDDEELAYLIEKLSRYECDGEELRHLLAQRIGLRYSELQTLR